MRRLGATDREAADLAGERGFIPISPAFNRDMVARQWMTVQEGARSVGRTANRADWRLLREVFVAPTDEEALELSLNGPMGRQRREFAFPAALCGKRLNYVKHDPDVPDSEITVEYLARHNWLVGSPDTVAEKLRQLYDHVGGFGVLLVICFDYFEQPHAWQRSMRLLAEEVMPRFAHLTARAPVAVS